jgi:hypothetical protein
VVAFENGTVVVRAGCIALRLRRRKGAAPDWTGRLHMSGPPGDHGKSVPFYDAFPSAIKASNRVE